MKVSKIILYFVVLVVSLLIAVFTGNAPSDSLNGFFSHILLGLWLCILFEYVSKIKRVREYSASLNNFVIIFGGLLVGTFYGIWGDFTTILQDVVLPINVSFNIWTLILAVPYLFFSMILLSFCISKYFTVFIGTKSIDARPFMIITSLILISFDFIYLVLGGNVFQNITPVTSGINLIILLNLCVLVIYFLFAITKRRPRISGFSMRGVSNRLNNIDRQIEDADRFADAARQREKKAQAQEQQKRDQRRRQRDLERKQSRRREQEEKARRKRQREQERLQRSKSKSSSKPQVSRTTSSSSVNKKELLRMKPKTGVLTPDDFKCIFCFELPSTSDGHRGIVLCPNCNYPAHVDEFKNWVRTSSLCSRCDGTIPSSFRRNPKVIPVKDYLRAYKFWKKKF
ncbi:hypothetical protein [Candidatus Lokiarchaeum ossiferum]|uniref:hypothetical protein n=1 Tax=Candidatus Lokiarchaeum ossiferum TaxID=2951803 RepID=UPI00352CA01F